MESWQVRWQDALQQELRREFPTFLEAWDFNERELKGRGEVTLLTDRALLSDRERSARSEAAVARQQEGGRRYPTRKK